MKRGSAIILARWCFPNATAITASAVGRVQPLGNSIDVEVDDPVLGQIALDKSLRPQPFGDLAYRSAREQPTPAFVRKRILDAPDR